MMPYALRPPFLSEVQKTVFVSGPNTAAIAKPSVIRNATYPIMAEINMANSLREARLFSGGWPERALTQINSRRITKFGSLAMFAAMQFNYASPKRANAIADPGRVVGNRRRIPGNADRECLAWLNCFTKS